MKRTLSEEQVLKKLDIPDFRHLSKDKVITFATMLPKMDREVAMKALEQFPDFASTSLNMLKELRGSLDKIIDNSNESTKSSIEAYYIVLDSLKSMLNDDNLSFDEKTYILENMKEVSRLIDKKDIENKQFSLKIAGLISGAVITITAMLGASIGVNSSKSSNNDEI